MMLELNSTGGNLATQSPAWFNTVEPITARSQPPQPEAVATPERFAPEPFYHPQAVALQRLADAAPAASTPSFDAQVRGQQPRPIDMKLAEISQAVYDPSNAGPAGWQRLDAAQLQAAGIDPSALEDPGTGFRAGIYSDGNGHYVLAFAGSNGGNDWLNNFEQGLGLPASQYREAESVAGFAKRAFGDNLVITGHSLGGGLAAAAAAKYDIAAVTFNASGVHDDTLRAAGLDPAAARQAADKGEIRAYSVDGEILTSLQEHRGAVLGALAAGGALVNPLLGGVAAGALLNGDLPPALGHHITLADPNPVPKPKLHWYDWLWGDAEVREAQYAVNEVKHSISDHMMGPVLSALASAHSDWPR